MLVQHLLHQVVDCGNAFVKATGVGPDGLHIEDGYGPPPTSPGWGTEQNEAVWAKYPPTNYTPIASEPYLAF